MMQHSCISKTWKFRVHDLYLDVTQYAIIYFVCNLLPDRNRQLQERIESLELEIKDLNKVLQIFSMWKH